jgi:hypothetical protein
VERQEQLSWERRFGKWAAAAAFTAAAFALVAFIYQRVAIKPTPGNAAQYLVSLHDKPTQYLIAVVLQALSVVLLSVVLYYLFKATRARRPELPKIALILAIAAPIAYGGVLIGTQVHQASVAADFVKTDRAKDVKVGAKVPKDVKKGEDKANDDATDRLAAGGGLAGVSIAATFALAVAFVLICMHAMRAGLLSRFMGILGIIIGALHVFQFFIPPALLLILWLPALGMLFLNRWPQQRGPAWESGEPEPWPKPPSRRAALEARAAGRDDEPDDDEPDDDEPEAETAREHPHTGQPARPRDTATHPRSKKKKRKRR